VGKVLAALGGAEDIVECAFVANDLTAAPFFSTPVRLGPNGIEEVMHFGQLSVFEQGVLDAMVPDLVGAAQKAVEFVAAADAKK
jgi:malate/lactate dehydrogenase